MFIRTSWPAPSASQGEGSFWGGGVFRTAGVPASRSAPTRTASAPVKAADRVTGDDIMFAVAMRFAIEFEPVSGETGETMRIVVEPGALDDSLVRIASGRAKCGLWFKHDAELQACSSKDGSLSFSVRGNELWFNVSGRTDRGRLAIGCARAAKRCRELSVGLSEMESTSLTHADGVRCHYVHRAELVEVSLLPRGACPRTWVTV